MPINPHTSRRIAFVALAIVASIAAAVVTRWALRSTPAVRTYIVRGQVVELPEPSNPRSAFRVRHQAIDDFENGSGTVVGMNAMTMEFDPGPGVSLAGLSPGAKIELTFEVWWLGEPPLRYPEHRVTRILKLPPDTELVFGPAKPPPPGTP